MIVEYPSWPSRLLVPSARTRPSLPGVHRPALLRFRTEFHDFDLHPVWIAQAAEERAPRRHAGIGKGGSLLAHPRHRGLEIAVLDGEVREPGRERRGGGLYLEVYVCRS